MNNKSKKPILNPKLDLDLINTINKILGKNQFIIKKKTNTNNLFDIKNKSVKKK